MSHAERGTVYSGDGRHGSDPGLYATLRLPGWKKAAVFLILVVVGCALWFAASPGVTSALFGVCLGPWSPNLPFVSVASVACGAMAMAGGFVFPKGFYLWGVALAIHSPFTQGLSVYVMEREGVGLVGGTIQDGGGVRSRCSGPRLCAPLPGRRVNAVNIGDVYFRGHT
jgi:hypothetical protein